MPSRKTLSIRLMPAGSPPGILVEPKGWGHSPRAVFTPADAIMAAADLLRAALSQEALDRLRWDLQTDLDAHDQPGDTRDEILRLRRFLDGGA